MKEKGFAWPLVLVGVTLVVIVVGAIIYFQFQSYPKSKPTQIPQSQTERVTLKGGFSFIVPENWVIRRQIKDFMISLAYFKESGNAKDKMCHITINIVMPVYHLTLEEFLNRTISANIYLDTYEPTMVAGQPALKGKDSFSLSGREGRLSIDRVYVKKEGMIVDMGLSYEEGKVDSQTVDLCKSDFDKLLQSSKFN